MSKLPRLEELFLNCAFDVEYKQAGDSVNYAFVEDGSTLYIYFQGSNSITDWVRNFMFKKKPYKHMDVEWSAHRGFLAAWKEVEDIIINKIDEGAADEKGYKWKKIIVIGYSHGGALAAFCHECVWFNRPDLRQDGLLGFGFEAPRIYGGFKVNEKLKERWATFTVIRNKNDIVTHCPPKLFRFCHVGTVLQIGENVDLVRHTKFKCVDAHYQDNVRNSLNRLKI